MIRAFAAGVNSSSVDCLVTALLGPQYEGAVRGQAAVDVESIADSQHGMAGAGRAGRGVGKLDGPYANAAGHDLNYIALAGALHGIGRQGDAPVPPLNLVGDFGGGGIYLPTGWCARYSRPAPRVGARSVPPWWTALPL